MTNELFTLTGPGTIFLISMFIFLLIQNSVDKIKSKMRNIVVIENPKWEEQNVFDLILIDRTEVWDNYDWRILKRKKTALELIQVVSVFGYAINGFLALIIIIGEVVKYFK